MFDSLDEAIRVLNARFQPAEVAEIRTHLQPALGFEPLAGGKVVVGGTRLGGVPDLPEGIAWPMRQAFAKEHPVMTRGGPSHAEHIETYGLKPFPMTFLAQIDLSEAQTVSPAAAKVLPKTGRLLFFYELNLGAWLDGPENGAGAVIFDQSDAADLKPRPTHPMLVADQLAVEKAWLEREAAIARGDVPDEAAELARQAEAMVDQMARDDHYRERYGIFGFAMRWIDRALGRTPWRKKTTATVTQLQTGDDQDPFAFMSRYESPTQPAKLTEIYTLPTAHDYAVTLAPKLATLIEQSDEDDDGKDYGSLVEWDSGKFETITGGVPQRLQRLLGHATPVQTDPRFGALFALEEIEDLPHHDANWQRATATRAMDLILLLQIDLATLMQRNVEGMVYFYIHKDDLAKRDFSKATAVYQQS